MFEKFLSANAADFAQRYEGTFGFYRNKDKQKLLVQISGAGQNRCSFVDARGSMYHVNADATDDIGFEFIPPKPSFYNCNSRAFLVRRIPARQWSRGISDRTVNISQLGVKNFLPAACSFENLDAIYLKAKTPAEAYSEWERRESVAISGQLAINKQGSIYLWNKPIGSFSKKDNHFMVKLEEPHLWRTEVSDAVRGIGCTVEVS